MRKGLDVIDHGSQANSTLDESRIKKPIREILDELGRSPEDILATLTKINEKFGIAPKHAFAEAIEKALKQEANIVSEKIKRALEASGIPATLEITLLEARERLIDASPDNLLAYLSYLVFVSPEDQ